MMRALWAVCMLGAGLAACGEGEVAPPAPSTDSTTESAPSPPSPPSPQRDPALLEAARSARGSGFAARFGSHRADDPATHFQLSGEARFAFRDPALEDRSFAFEVALAGPSVQRYQLSAGQRKNWFLLAGPGDCWVKTPEDQQPKPASARAGELGEDAALRWLILGFPAHLEGAAAQQRAELEYIKKKVQQDEAAASSAKKVTNVSKEQLTLYGDVAKLLCDIVHEVEHGRDVSGGVDLELEIHLVRPNAVSLTQIKGEQHLGKHGILGVLKVGASRGIQDERTVVFIPNSKTKWNRTMHQKNYFLEI